MPSRMPGDDPLNYLILGYWTEREGPNYQLQALFLPLAGLGSIVSQLASGHSFQIVQLMFCLVKDLALA